MSPVLVRRLPRRSLPVALALCLAVVLGACSGSSSPAASGSGSAPHVASGGAGACVAGGDFCGHIKITGGVTRETDFSSYFSEFGTTNCTDWLKGSKDDPTLLTLPTALVGDINTDAVIQNYKGPGTYAVADLGGNLGGFQIAVVHDTFITDANTTGTATVAADGSGSVTATGMQPSGDANVVQQPIDVTMTWTCSAK